MKIKILVKEDLVKTYNVLDAVKKNPFLQESQDLITYYNDKNQLEVFEQAFKEFRKGKFRRFIVVDDNAYGPFLFFSKQPGIVVGRAFDEFSANLIRAHNNSKVCIIPLLKSDPAKLSNIITAFSVSEFESGRHVTRLQIMHGAFKPAEKKIEFSKTPTKTVVIGSDHAGYGLKEMVKEHLIEKGYKVIDVGTNSLDSTHYSLYAAAMAEHYHEASFAIGCCWTGVGIANTLNKFKGIKACICSTPTCAKQARELYNANTLVMGAKFITRDAAYKTVDAYLETPMGKNPIFKPIEEMGFNFDKQKLKDIKLEKNVVVPPELE